MFFLVSPHNLSFFFSNEGPSRGNLNLGWRHHPDDHARSTFGAGGFVHRRSGKKHRRLLNPPMSALLGMCVEVRYRQNFCSRLDHMITWNFAIESQGNSYERAGTLGFRCAADVRGGAPAPYHYRKFDIEFVWGRTNTRRQTELWASPENWNIMLFFKRYNDYSDITGFKLYTTFVEIAYLCNLSCMH